MDRKEGACRIGLQQCLIVANGAGHLDTRTAFAANSRQRVGSRFSLYLADTVHRDRTGAFLFVLYDPAGKWIAALPFTSGKRHGSPGDAYLVPSAQASYRRSHRRDGSPTIGAAWVRQ
jgi:hypothetical protein